MLHAVLHRKLDELVPEPHRREDALTSAAFGTLIMVDAWDILVRWLGVSDRNLNSRPRSNNCWFWPRLAFAEPDVVLRLDDLLIVVEVKYRSGRSDLGTSADEDDDSCDQLVRQHRSMTEPVEHRVRYAEPIEQAIAECRLVQVFIVDARRQRRARREWEESQRRLPQEALLRFVTWQDLFRLLNQPMVQHSRWAMDLRSYLQVCGLDTFEGIGRRLTRPKDVTRIREWHEQHEYRHLQHTVAVLIKAGQGGVLERWRPLAKSIANERRFHRIDHKVIERASHAILLWGRYLE